MLLALANAALEKAGWPVVVAPGRQMFDIGKNNRYSKAWVSEDES
jgi:hypothetical protein